MDCPIRDWAWSPGKRIPIRTPPHATPSYMWRKPISKLYKYLLKVLTCHSELHVEVILIHTHGALQDKTYYFFKMHIRRLREIQELTVCLTYGKQGSKNTLLKVMIFSFYLQDPPKVPWTILHVTCQKKCHPKFNSNDPFGLSNNKIINNKFYSTLFAIVYLEGNFSERLNEKSL